MAKNKNPFGFREDNLQRQKVLPSKTPQMSEYDFLKGFYKPEDLPINTTPMPFHLQEKTNGKREKD